MGGWPRAEAGDYGAETGDSQMGGGPPEGVGESMMSGLVLGAAGGGDGYGIGEQGQRGG